MVAIPNLPLRRKTPAHTPPADAPESITEAAPPAVSTPNATAPRMPSQGHTQDDDDFNVPPPPTTPNGDYLCRVKNVYVPIKDGKWETWDNGDPKSMKIFFTIDDPKEQRLSLAGKESCWGTDVSVNVDLVGNFYSQTIANLTTLGAPRVAWPVNGKGKTSMPMLADYITTVTKGKKFLLTIKSEPGKGDKKTTLYTNVKKIAVPPAPPKAAPKPAPAPAAVEPDPIDTSDEAEQSGSASDNGDAEQAEG